MDNLEQKIKSVDTLEELEKLRVEIFGKKGSLSLEFLRLKDLSEDERKEFAKNLNIKKDSLNKIFTDKKIELENKEILNRMQKDSVDVSMACLQTYGATHVVKDTMDKIIKYFLSLNFSLEDGPLIEDEFHNFEALNLPSYHPARDMQDTFYFDDNSLLRTHTSPVQIRKMLSSNPPIKMIAPGAVFRRDLDLTHTPMFHQIEGLVVDKDISFANLKFILKDFLNYMFGDVKIRFRPSFFPFTEPSSEVDIGCIFCNNSGCRVCSNTGWLEVLGAGMVDPNVFSAVNYKDVSGYAFGLGVERFAMLIHKIPDLRSLFEGDIRLLEQFK